MVRILSKIVFSKTSAAITAIAFLLSNIKFSIIEYNSIIWNIVPLVKLNKQL